MCARDVTERLTQWCFSVEIMCFSDVVTRKAVEYADVLLNQTHGFVRLDNIWGTGGGTRPVKLLTKKVRACSGLGTFHAGVAEPKMKENAI